MRWKAALAPAGAGAPGARSARYAFRSLVRRFEAKHHMRGDWHSFLSLKLRKWSFTILTMVISVTQFKHHCLKIIRRLEQTGAPVAITRRGKVVAQLQAPAVSKSGRAQKPWERLRAMGGRLLAEPGESVLRDKDFEALH